MPGRKPMVTRWPVCFMSFTCPKAGANRHPALQLDASLIEVPMPGRKGQHPSSIHVEKGRKHGTQIVTKPAFKAVGILICRQETRMARSPDVGPASTKRFNEPKASTRRMLRTVLHQCQGCQGGEFEYVAAVEVADDQNVPRDGLPRGTGLQVCLFTHHGKLDTLGEPTSTSITPACPGWPANPPR